MGKWGILGTRLNVHPLSFYCVLHIRLLGPQTGREHKQIKDELCEVVSEMESLDSQEDCKYSNKDKQMSIGRKKFNMDPKKGIEYLRENHLIRMDPQDVAYFLYKGEGLNKTAIGDYLGEKNDFNEQVLKAFVELHDFTNLILVQALRQFLWSFRLPGEAQKIDRMMECFAQRYCQLNPDIFTNTDTCYVLSFAIIMLNTSLHNPSVKDKPSIEQFISMNRGINNGGDLPRELLESLYESIRTEPFKIPQDDGNDLMHTFFNPDKEGWLWKQGGRYKSWKRRWFILNDNCLYYFEYTTDKEPRGIIPLENISVREISDRNKPHCFELYACGGADIIKACKTDSEGKVRTFVVLFFCSKMIHQLVQIVGDFAQEKKVLKRVSLINSPRESSRKIKWRIESSPRKQLHAIRSDIIIPWSIERKIIVNCY
ncbi:cytohesin-1 isoform X5 [Lutzomyia longipalpis]|uniref:cytohesin-1 isoform X5 n=1 Tax=Lutzomyia longipalpis TaxID=7200 RepID=UPI0024841116|nr:cytohesin-1 isoform X5 [Lutzomyia longipalpis]